MARPATDPKIRFLRMTVRDGACLRWTGSFFRDGYGQFQWRHEGKLNWRAHRAAWTLFVGPILEGEQVLHRCNHSWCVDFENCLYCGDHGQNMIDRELAGNCVRGEQSPSAVLTDAKVFEIRERRALGATYQVLGDEYGVTHGAVWQAANSKTWKHVPEVRT